MKIKAFQNIVAIFKINSIEALHMKTKNLK